MSHIKRLNQRRALADKNGNRAQSSQKKQTEGAKRSRPKTDKTKPVTAPKTKK